MKIYVDTYGADLGPKVMVEGALLAKNKREFTPIFIGNKKEIEDIIAKRISDYEIIETDSYISNDEDPVRSIRRKKDSSLVLAYDLIKGDYSSGLISAGSTGAILAGGLFIAKRIDGVDRAALATILPTIEGISLLMDTGANMDCKPIYLKEFAIMGKVYLENVLKIKNPKIALLNVGAEDKKGNKLTKETAELLRETDLNFVGNVEARDLFTGKVNVILADGFAGNIAIKTAEGVIDLFKDQLKEVFYKSTKNKLAALAIKNDLKATMGKFSAQKIGGVPLLGVKSYVYKAHGNSSEIAISNAIDGLIDYINMGVIEKIQGELND